MTISRDIWSIIFKHLHVEHFLNAMLAEKAAYEGFKLHFSPTLTLKNAWLFNNETNFDQMSCHLCSEHNIQDMYINYTHPLSSTDLSSPCCRRIVCPKCPLINKKEKIITFHYLFIKNVIYLQPKEKEPVPLHTDRIQYNRWVPCESFPETIMKNYSIVDNNYNSFTSKKMRTIQIEQGNNKICYADVCARCICKYCGFECGVRNYMNLFIII